MEPTRTCVHDQVGHRNVKESGFKVGMSFIPEIVCDMSWARHMQANHGGPDANWFRSKSMSKQPSQHNYSWRHHILRDSSSRCMSGYNNVFSSESSLCSTILLVGHTTSFIPPRVSTNLLGHLRSLRSDISKITCNS